MIVTLRLDGVAILKIDNPPVNVLSSDVSAALLDALAAAEADPGVVSIVVMGAGRTFVAGADIRSLEQAALGRLDAAIDMHEALARIENCTKPVVMAIHGTALGGGLELAMAGRYRVCAPDARLGQPEVNLGVIPGAEGTQRLPRLVGIAAALDLCLTGQPIDARRALAIGLVDRVVEGDLMTGAADFARQAAAARLPAKTRDRRDRLGGAAENAPLFAAARARADAMRPGEPAPVAAVEAIEAAATLPFDEGRRKERELFFRCVQSDQARSMIRAFFERRKKRPENDPGGRFRVRPVRIVDAGVHVDRRADGATYVRAAAALGAYPATISARLEQWAHEAPDRPFLAERAAEGHWHTTTYGEMYERVRGVAQWLLTRGLSADRPVTILSGNSIDHACLALAAMHVGIPYAPVSPAYSLLSRDHKGLARIFGIFRPALVYAQDGGAFEPALRAVVGPETEVVVSSRGERRATVFEELAATPATAAVDRAHAGVTADTIAKVLFTSGSTGRPKGVINTQRMLCANQEMIRSRLAFLGDQPPVFCDWLPWNHTFGGNHNFGCTLYNGGTLYIDHGRPTPAEFDQTVRNLRDVSPSVYFNVPRGFEMLIPRLRTDSVLRARFFSKLQLLFFAAAGLPQHLWDELQSLAVEACGEEILMITGLGSTESAPAALFTGRHGAASGWVGVPLPGVELKLAPVGEKIEACLRGPSITPGYWHDAELTAAAFDAEGFYRMGDAVRWIDPHAPELGLIFDGRLAEDFKLSSGTWVSVGPLRAKLLLHGAGLLHDVVIVGPDRTDVTALIFPNVTACRALCPDLAPSAPVRAVLDDPRVRGRFQDLLTTFGASNPGGSMHVARAILLDEPPCFETGETTDKGTLNQKTIMNTRAADVRVLYDAPPAPRVLVVDPLP